MSTTYTAEQWFEKAREEKYDRAERARSIEWDELIPEGAAAYVFVLMEREISRLQKLALEFHDPNIEMRHEGGIIFFSDVLGGNSCQYFYPLPLAPSWCDTNRKRFVGFIYESDLIHSFESWLKQKGAANVS